MIRRLHNYDDRFPLFCLHLFDSIANLEESLPPGGDLHCSKMYVVLILYTFLPWLALIVFQALLQRVTVNAVYVRHTLGISRFVLDDDVGIILRGRKQSI